jgi:hypothetical protein
LRCGFGIWLLAKACCAFLDSQLAVKDGQLLWDITTIDDDIARAVLDDYYDQPNSAGTDARAAAVYQRFAIHGHDRPRAAR